MTYAYLVDVPAPVELYDAVHAEVDRRSGGHADGLLVHLGRATATGFQVLEVWESKEQADRFGDEFVRPAMASAGAGAVEGPEPPRQEFEPRGLMLSGARAATAS
jgi:hypothetical protein